MANGNVPGQQAVSSPLQGAAARQERLLIIGQHDDAPLKNLPLSRCVPIYTLFSMIDRRLLNDVQPVAVLAPLITASYDILDVAMLLDSHGFRGTLFIQSKPLPRADLVMRELTALCPSLTLTLVVTD